jgi:hypothetical protein
VVEVAEVAEVALLMTNLFLTETMLVVVEVVAVSPMVLLVQEMQNVVVLVVKDNLLMVEQAQKLEQVEAV